MAAEKLLRRAVIAQGDLAQAHAFARELCVAGHSAVVREALTLASVVAYARPFKKSNGGEADRLIAVDTIPQLSPADSALHDYVIGLRDTEMAHSDTKAHCVSISIRDGVAIPTGRSTRQSFDDRTAIHFTQRNRSVS